MGIFLNRILKVLNSSIRFEELNYEDILSFCQTVGIITKLSPCSSQEDNLTGRQPYRKTTSQEDDLTGRRPHGKTTSQKDDLTGRQPHREKISQEDNLTGIRLQRKTTSKEDNLT